MSCVHICQNLCYHECLLFMDATVMGYILFTYWLYIIQRAGFI